MDTGDYELLGYFLLIIYLAIVVTQAVTLYQIATPSWHAFDWIAILVALSLMPGLPGLLLILPAKVLEPWIATICQTLGFVGILAAFAWGFVFDPEWFLVASLAIALNLVCHKVYTQKII